MLVGTLLNVSGRHLALGVAGDRQALVDIDGHPADGVHELLEAVDVQHHEVVDVEPQGLADAQFEGVGAGIVGGAHGVLVLVLHRAPHGVGEEGLVVSVAVGESVRIDLVERGVLREGQVGEVAGDLDDGRVAGLGVDGGHHHGVGVHLAVLAVVAGRGVVPADQQHVDPGLLLPDLGDALAVVDGGAGAGSAAGEDPAQGGRLVPGVARRDRQRCGDGERQGPDQKSRYPALGVCDPVRPKVEMGEDQQSDQGHRQQWQHH
jgi:hypothetical protein